MALEVSSHNNGKDAEHGVPAIPTLSVGGHTEAAASKLGVLLSELLNSLGHGVSHTKGADACNRAYIQNPVRQIVFASQTLGLMSNDSGINSLIPTLFPFRPKQSAMIC